MFEWSNVTKTKNLKKVVSKIETHEKISDYLDCLPKKLWNYVVFY